MNLENIPQKQLNELEHGVRQLLITMRKAKLQNEPLINALKSLEQELEQARRARFDKNNAEYPGY